MEIWKDIPGYEGLYQVSNLGCVKSLPKYSYRDCGKVHCFYKEKVLYQSKSKHGYLYLRLSKNKDKKIYKVHQLVTMAFLNHKPCGHEIVVDHINGNKLDNRVENLQLITNRENSRRVQGSYTSSYKGVSWKKSAKKWISQIQVNKKPIHLGYFKCELAASIAYQNKLKTL